MVLNECNGSKPSFTPTITLRATFHPSFTKFFRVNSFTIWQASLTRSSCSLTAEVTGFRDVVSARSDDSSGRTQRFTKPRMAPDGAALPASCLPLAEGTGPSSINAESTNEIRK